ncbi:hypothetical protein CIN_18890 [Commensalibacter intestini A911]|uniref:Uncharacterized protein n=1 Tax=Commensalibacter intestini A911 TaxID=1088868 RepID=G6F2P3_9PROT|nr:hypothetical protein CIN_18890 [Commensalibacter intestini A911]
MQALRILPFGRARIKELLFMSDADIPAIDKNNKKTDYI